MLRSESSLTLRICDPWGVLANHDAPWVFEFSFGRDGAETLLYAVAPSDFTHSVDCVRVVFDADRNGKRSQT